MIVSFSTNGSFFIQIDELENNREQLLDNLDKNAEDISEAEQHLDDIDRSLDASDLEDSEKVSSDPKHAQVESNFCLQTNWRVKLRSKSCAFHRFSYQS